MTPVLEQWQIFMSLAGAGIALALAFDCYRVGRYYWRPGPLTTHVGDAMFWIVFTFLTFAYLLLVNWGEVRVYVFLALASGASLYMLFLGRRVRKLLYAGVAGLARLLNYGQRCLGRVLLVVFIPGRWLVSFLSWPFSLPKKAWHRAWRGRSGPPA